MIAPSAPVLVSIGIEIAATSPSTKTMSPMTTALPNPTTNRGQTFCAPSARACETLASRPR